ncbi:MAG TPA: Crp/Fnr family transcriptional regulator [Methylococcaceae bacterium]|nr:Crp/Fnr family transcriptional regulator [Methylococcaceae bacterium]
MDNLLEGLMRIPYFSEISRESVNALASHASHKTFPKNAIIINEGDEAGPLYVILSGKVRVFLGDDAGKVITLSIQESGSYFGELSLLDDTPRSASVMTLEKTVCGLIAKAEFRKWLADHPDAALGIIKGLTRRIRMLTESVRGFALFDVYGRLNRLLSDLAVDVEGKPTILERPSHQEMANRIGASREMVSRIMKDLVNGGYLRVEGKSLIINRKLPASW